MFHWPPSETERFTFPELERWHRVAVRAAEADDAPDG